MTQDEIEEEFKLAVKCYDLRHGILDNMDGFLDAIKSQGFFISKQNEERKANMTNLVEKIADFLDHLDRNYEDDIRSGRLTKKQYSLARASLVIAKILKEMECETKSMLHGSYTDSDLVTHDIDKKSIYAFLHDFASRNDIKLD